MNGSQATWNAAATSAQGDRSVHAPVAARRPPLDLPRIAIGTALILGLWFLNKGGEFGSVVFFIILTVMALLSPDKAMKAMAIMFAGLLLNVAFVPKTIFWTPGRLALPVVILLRYGFHLFVNPRLLLGRPYYLMLLVYVATMAACSIASGWYTKIALFKLGNFIAFMTTAFLVTALVRERKQDLSEWFVSLIIAAALIGVLAVATGQSRNFVALRTGQTITSDSLFNGAFLHPNAHALYASGMTVFLCCIYILAPYRHRLAVVPVIVLWLVFMLLSQSRTSVFATTVPLLVLVALAAPRTVRGGRQLRSNVRRSTLVAILVAAVGAAGVFDLASGGVVSKSIIGFLHKWSDREAESLDTETMLASRQSLIDQAWGNFVENPWTGIGFQVAKTQAFMDNATFYTAPAEKGFLPVAILEEGGVVGATAFALFLLVLVGTWYRERNIPAIIVFTSFLTSNMGEATMLAPGGGGAFGWICVAAATIMGDNCWTRAPRAATDARRRTSSPPLGPPEPIWPGRRTTTAACSAGGSFGGTAPTSG
jgi:O-antigen ligase